MTPIKPATPTLPANDTSMYANAQQLAEAWPAKLLSQSRLQERGGVLRRGSQSSECVAPLHGQ